MIEVQTYYDAENDRWNGYVVTITAHTEQEMKDAVVAEYNRATGETKTLGDFSFSS